MPGTVQRVHPRPSRLRSELAQKARQGEFQFCGALVNYDMPWNPMRVEQRIGRIDRLGQRHAIVRISNLHYEDTVETDVYRALGSRINLFQRVVGPLQPILARLPGTITNTVLADPRTEAPDRADLREAIER